jgi:hypothetical protein
MILYFNKFTWKERFKTFMHDGISFEITSKDLAWDGRKLFCE